MALSEKWALEKARGLMWNPQYTGFDPVAFTRAIEAEAHKEYEALIRQLVEALEKSQEYTEACANGKRVQWWGSQLDRAASAITAGRARLDSTTRSKHV